MIVHEFTSRDEASRECARAIVAALKRRTDAEGSASLVVSGGTTPVACYAELSKMHADWQNVYILLSDERWVGTDHEDSNERLLRDTLLIGHAEASRLLPVFRDDISIEARCRQIDEEIRQRPFPFACALLGMGADGHFASLFPDYEFLADGLDPDFDRFCVPVQTAASPHARLSLTLAALSRSDEILLLIFGEEKRQTLELAGKNGNDLPVSQLLRQKRAPVSVYWAP